jgi:ABC-type amino acid transport substrate-binding protein
MGKAGLRIAATFLCALFLSVSVAACGGDDDEGDEEGTELALVALETSDIADLDDLASQGAKQVGQGVAEDTTLGVVEGSVGEDYARAEGSDFVEARTYPNGFEAVQAVRVGLIDAAVLDQALAEDEVENQANAAASKYAMKVQRVPQTVHIASTFSP